MAEPEVFTGVGQVTGSDAVCWEGVQEGTVLLAPPFAGIQSLPPLLTVKLGPSGADSRVGGLVHALGPCGSLQRTLL